MSRWGDPQTVAGFSRSEPNATLMRFVESEMGRKPRTAVLDLGCGAGRNAVPIAALGCSVLGTDIEWPILESARAGRPGAGLFVFTFSRHTLAPDAEPVPGEPFVFTQFSGEPQCFLTEVELLAELASAGFAPLGPIAEHNRPRRGQLNRGGPVIYEGAFRLRS